MDEKSINLWRQINAHRLSGGQPSTLMRSNAELEGCQRAKTIEHGQRGALTERKSRGRGKSAAPLASTAANDPAWTPRDFEFR
jgi:hypothetical protein